MLAYVFWHWRRPEVNALEYEDRQRGFHASLAASPSPGFVESFSFDVWSVPWTAGSPACEDWYLVRDFGALGLLNEAAVSGSRTAPHDAAASGAAGGAGGLYALKGGMPLRQPRYAHWFGKPDGMLYRDLFARLAPLVERVGGALWMRQMVLGPAREFCLHASSPVPVQADLDALIVPLRQTWPDSGSIFHHFREIPASPEAVFEAFRNPDRLARWWGPDGFTNTFHIFDFQAGGAWHFTMHGADGTAYPNQSEFLEIVPNARIRIRHVNLPHFELSISLDPSAVGTRVSWIGAFENREFAENARQFLEAAAEQNLDRLTTEVGGRS